MYKKIIRKVIYQSALMIDLDVILSERFHSVHHLPNYLEYSCIASLCPVWVVMYIQGNSPFWCAELSFDKHIQLSNHYCNQDTEYFQHPKTFPRTPGYPVSSRLSWSHFHSIALLILGCHIHRITVCLALLLHVEITFNLRIILLNVPLRAGFPSFPQWRRI